MTQTSNPPLPDHPLDGATGNPMKDNALLLSTIGLARINKFCTAMDSYALRRHIHFGYETKRKLHD